MVNAILCDINIFENVIETFENLMLPKIHANLNGRPTNDVHNPRKIGSDISNGLKLDYNMFKMKVVIFRSSVFTHLLYCWMLFLDEPIQKSTHSFPLYFSALSSRDCRKIKVTTKVIWINRKPLSIFFCRLSDRSLKENTLSNVAHLFQPDKSG